jgi:general secretion pathway protein E
MTIHSAGTFMSFLAQTGGLSSGQAGASEVQSLRAAWEATELPAGDFADLVALFYGLPRITLPQLMAATPQLAGFSTRFLREMGVMPYRAADGTLCLATGDPSDLAATRAAELVLDSTIALTIASFEDIASVLAQRLGEADAPLEEAAPSTVEPLVEDLENLRDLASGAPVVRAVNDIFEKAIELRASDIHIGPFRNGIEVRMRVDGLLRTVTAPAGVLPRAIISRIKILAGLDIAERRLPQDGAARLKLSRDELDVRVAIMPTQHGEAAVIRLLPRDRGQLSVEKLGLAAHDQAKLTDLMTLPHGMIVVTGPTGSGKTTTLATILSALNEPSRKILTIEDPVEYEIRGIYQSQVKPSIGLTFATALRAFVRHDPDVIMVGEVRDAETAHVAVHAALTGHLVLTTLHTETAAAAVPRMLDLGVEAFLLKSVLRAVIAQRLVRQLCERCRRARVLTASDLASDPRYSAVGFKPGETVYEPHGCERCGGAGYRGRVGAFEILVFDERLREMIEEKSGGTALDRAAVAGGMTTMFDDGMAKCRAGITSPAEVLRVTTLR